MTATVFGLVAVTWGMEKWMEADTWPFRWVWGGVLVATGIIVFAMGRISPDRIRRLPGGNPAAPLPPPPSREARIAVGSLAACLVVSGLVYGLTGRLAAFTVAIAVVVLFGRLVAARGTAA